MGALLLSEEQIRKLVSDNKYTVDKDSKYLSRCFDDRDSAENVPSLSIPGGDVGEIALILAAGNAYGFEVDIKKSFDALSGLVGGRNNLSFHSNISLRQSFSGACGHFNCMRKDPAAYSIEKVQLDAIGQELNIFTQSGTKTNYKNHDAGALLLVRGAYSLPVRGFVDTAEGKVYAEYFVFHHSLANERHKILADVLIEKKAVRLFPGCGAEYLYEVLAEMTEQHLFETTKKLARGLPIYRIEFHEDGEYTIDRTDTVR